MLPSVSQVTRTAERLFVLEDAHNLGVNYHLTLLAWENNFRKSWPYFQDSYGERFYRMWRFYLLSCAGAFRARDIQVFQFLFSKGGSTRRIPPYCTLNSQNNNCVVKNKNTYNVCIFFK